MIRSRHKASPLPLISPDTDFLSSPPHVSLSFCINNKPPGRPQPGSGAFSDHTPTSRFSVVNWKSLVFISDPLVPFSPAWTEQHHTVLMVLPSFIISRVLHPRVSERSPLIPVQPLRTGLGLAHESNITLKRDGSRLADVAARQLSL